MGWNYLSMPKLQRLHRWSLGIDKQFHPTLYNGCSWHRSPHISTHDVQNIVEKILRYTGLFYHIWMFRWHRQLKCSLSLSEDKNQFILHRQYYDHWWLVDSTSQGIYNHGIDLVRSEYSRFTVEFPAQRPVTWSFDVFFDLRLNKLLSKQSWGWWFETPSRSS